MGNIKKAVAAGRFYTSIKEELQAQLDLFYKNNRTDYQYSTRAVIVPHAGYYYSGQLASEGFQYLNKDVKNVFIIAPAHYLPFQGLALSDFAHWSTPLGEIPVNQEINKELIEKFNCKYLNEAFSEEHSVEVQVPFIQTNLSEVNIIPILVGSSDNKRIANIINHYWKNPENAFVISSDLSHFYDTKDAQKIDNLTAEMIESKAMDQFNPNQACGSVGVQALVRFAKDMNYSLIRVGLKNSGDVTGDTKRVVGYGSWLLYEGEIGKFLKEYFSDFIIGVCRKSIYAGLYDKPMEYLKQIPEVFKEEVACFVTLEKHGELRGCIGSIVAHRPLIDDLVKNAYNSAFSDARFAPLKKEEFDDLSIDVSILSAPVKMTFEDENDLLSQIVPSVDGIIIKDGFNQSVYLPSVWEQLPEKTLFLNSLKIKAGLNPNHFSPNFEAYKFTTEYVKSER